MKLLFFSRYFLLLFVFILLKPSSLKAYSVLTHEAVIDASWQTAIRPLLKQKYPLATDSELMVAHSYAYGGCMMPDMGYFPFGSEYFTNLAHYVRTGDFVEALFSEVRSLNDYAFALGALCHYMADKYGHSLATNHVVPLVYPAMRRKYGDTVTYEENHTDHSRVEISFDVLQVARGNYATQAYHDFIGFNVAKPLLERAFLKTYGEDINNVFGDFDLAVSTFRWSVKTLLPELTRAGWVLKKDEIKELNPSANSRNFHYKMRRRDYYQQFGKKRSKPTLREDGLAAFISILPKIGPFKALRFRDPGPAGEKLFIASFDTVLVKYAAALDVLKTGKISLPDIDYDTGNRTVFGEYNLTDETYGDMLYRLKEHDFYNLTAPLKANIISFYNNADTMHFAKVNPVIWKKTYAILQQVKQAPTIKTDSLKTAKGLSYELER